MFIPKSFQATDEPWLRQAISACHFGTLVYRHPDAWMDAIPLPFLSTLDAAGLGGVLHLHAARAQGLCRALAKEDRVLFILSGPNGYVSPSLYPSKLIDGRVVPTWNYVAIHIQGNARTIDEAAWLRRHVTAMTNRHEQDRALPWHVDDAPDGYVDALLKAAVGIEIRITAVSGVIKGSQNKPPEARAAIAREFARMECPQTAGLAKFASDPMLGKASSNEQTAAHAAGERSGEPGPGEGTCGHGSALPTQASPNAGINISRLDRR